MAAHETSESLTDRELAKTLRPFAQEDRARTWRLLLITLGLLLAASGVAALAPWWPLQLAGAILAGLPMVRTFIFYHDAMHGAVFRGSLVGMALLKLFGLYIMNPPSVWKETHDYHHQNNAKMLGSSIGSYPVVTTRMWRRMDPSERRWYAFARHPLTILFGYFTIFVGGMCISAFVRQPRTHWQGLLALTLQFGSALLVGLGIGWSSALFAVILPTIIAAALGAYLFYAQHNFPTIELRGRATWDYHHAALRSSSMFEMHPVLHWFTGNIGFHHIHHLNHRIPFYNLPTVMEEVPALRNVGRTSWRPSDIRACFALKIWDSQDEKMVGWP